MFLFFWICSSRFSKYLRPPRGKKNLYWCTYIFYNCVYCDVIFFQEDIHRTNSCKPFFGLANTIWLNDFCGLASFWENVLPIQFQMSQGRSTAYIGDGHPTFNERNPYNWYINPYYWVDDHPLLYENNGSFFTLTQMSSFESCHPKKWRDETNLADWVYIQCDIPDENGRSCCFFLAFDIWVFPKNRGTPKSCILIGVSIIFTIHFGVPLFLETSI